LLRRSFATAQEAGDFKYAVYTCDRLVMLLLAAGDPLGEVQREAENGLRFERTAKFGFIVQSRRGTGQISMPKVHEIGILDGRASAFIDSMITHCDGGARYWP